MARTRKYEELIVWQRSMDFVDLVYEFSATWPQQETYRLVDQIRRAVISVPANIAEGHGRTGKNEFSHHCSIAYGSLMEAETLLTIAKRRGYLTSAQHESALEYSDEIGRLIRGVMTALRRNGTK